jgi:transcriptional regulator with XRE-family HTH domain
MRTSVQFVAASLADKKAAGKNFPMGPFAVEHRSTGGIMTTTTRGTLTDFLKSRRARLRPEDVGLPVSRHRRLSGLRREEVAALAGVGDTWYGLFESGKPIRISPHLIDSVGNALRLTSDELRYLHSLVLPDSESQIDLEYDAVDPLVAASLAAIENVPAFVSGPRLDYLAYNDLARLLYRLPAYPAPVLTNLPLRLFVGPDARELYPNWAGSAARAVSMLRSNYGTYRGNESFQRLVDHLSAISTDFKRLWELHEITPALEHVSEALGLPDGSRFRYRLQAFQVPGSRDQLFVMLLPLDATDATLLRQFRQATVCAT